MEWLTNPEIWAALVTLTALEIVLGIDNIIFLSIIVSKLPKQKQDSARIVGLAGAMITRILLLFSLSWLAGLTKPWFTVIGLEISGRDLVLIVGGLFLLWKATTEIGEQIEGGHEEDGIKVKAVAGYAAAIVQIMLIDIVFSLDSVITAVGMTNNLPVMVSAIVIAVLTMMVFAAPLSRFVDRHPTIKVLALAFLMLVGMALVGEGFDFHIPKGYLYFAMAFSVGVEIVNLRVRAKSVAARKKKD
ncbi:MAG TPA: TerC family protein [Verrucomicrobiae bacterium]|nr:TerC family protein [Verrucomicrobiae bacterium]